MQRGAVRIQARRSDKNAFLGDWPKRLSVKKDYHIPEVPIGKGKWYTYYQEQDQWYPNAIYQVPVDNQRKADRVLFQYEDDFSDRPYYLGVTTRSCRLHEVEDIYPTDKTVIQQVFFPLIYVSLR